MILLEFSMSPMDKGESVSDQVSRSLKIIDESGVPYRLNPMGTVLEGEFDEVMGVVSKSIIAKANQEDWNLKSPLSKTNLAKKLISNFFHHRRTRIRFFSLSVFVLWLQIHHFFSYIAHYSLDFLLGQS